MTLLQITVVIHGHCVQCKETIRCNTEVLTAIFSL